MNKKIAIILAFAVAVCSIFTSGCSGVKVRTFYALDTSIKITAYDCTDKIIDSMVERVNSYDAIFNIYNNDSEIYKLNTEGRLEEASETLISVLSQSLNYAKMTEGAFDPTIGAVSLLWDFENQTVPKDEDIQAALKTVDYNNVAISGKRIILKNGAKLDLGAIVKGYAVGNIASRLKLDGIKRATLDFGGTVYVFGEKSIRIGIQTPFGEADQISAEIAASTQTVVATSGNYQRYFDKNGKRYHHILDPKTGYPVNNHLESVSVIGTNSAMDDAFSTALFVLGREKAMQLVKRVKGMEAVFIEDDDSLYYTDGLTYDGDYTFTVKQNG